MPSLSKSRLGLSSPGLGQPSPVANGGPASAVGRVIAGNCAVCDYGQQHPPVLDRKRDWLAKVTHPRTHRRLSTSMISRVLTLLRETADRWAGAGAIPSRVTRRPAGSLSRVGRRRPRRPPSPTELAALLGVNSDDTTLALVLAGGAGLRPGEMLGLRTSDIECRRGRIPVRGGSVPGRPGVPQTRHVQPAAWVWPILAELVPAGSPDGWLFPGADPRHPRRRLDKLMRTACKRAFGAGGQRFTLMDVRRLWQRAARRKRLPRAVVRGSWTEARSPRWRGRVQQGLGELSREWRRLDTLPGLPAGRSGRVPRRAPRGRYSEPEVPWPMTEMPPLRADRLANRALPLRRPAPPEPQPEPVRMDEPEVGLSLPAAQGRGRRGRLLGSPRPPGGLPRHDGGRERSPSTSPARRREEARRDAREQQLSAREEALRTREQQMADELARAHRAGQAEVAAVWMAAEIARSPELGAAVREALARLHAEMPHLGEVLMEVAGELEGDEEPDEPATDWYGYGQV